MKIIKIVSFLVAPGKSIEDADPSKGTEIPLTGSLYNMLSEVFEKSHDECNTPIRFKMSASNGQTNPVREHLISIMRNPELASVRHLADRLRDYTTRKSGLGLLFVVVGIESELKKIVISRFPADQGILAETQGDDLEIEFVEQIFMKSSRTYKSAVYEGVSFDSDFWTGFVVDKQLSLQHSDIAQYWIHDFLNSDFRTTPKAGSKRIALALKDATNKATDLKVKDQIITSTKMLHNLAGKNISIGSIVRRFNLPDEVKDIIFDEVGNTDLLHDEFILDLDEFQKYIKYTSIELDKGQIITAPSEIFDDCIKKEKLEEKNNIYRFSTEGEIIDEKIKGKK
ncbi:MAG TPA: hypothetical protein PKC29_09175 [Thermodesulfobacteriota bacterium]|nr:hypothetical protein [Thermodesulfobacteriota bacterium]